MLTQGFDATIFHLLLGGAIELAGHGLPCSLQRCHTRFEQTLEVTTVVVREPMPSPYEPAAS